MIERVTACCFIFFELGKVIEGADGLTGETVGVSSCFCD
jgi:hypothetical protein